MSQQKEIIEINVNIDRLKGRRGILCGLLCAAVFGTLLCLGLFAGKTNEINSAGSTLESDYFCSLFVKRIVLRVGSSYLLKTSDPSICHYVIGGSVIVFLILLVLLMETLLAVFFAFAFTE